MNMKNIPIGKNGQILSGDYKDWWIRVEPANKGGHSILFIQNIRDPKDTTTGSWRKSWTNISTRPSSRSNGRNELATSYYGRVAG
jgi:hypothetical protein